MTPKLLYAIRSENMHTYGYGYVGKPISSIYHLTWYAKPLDATHYKSKASAQRRAKYYQELGIECRVVEIFEDFDACGVHRFKDAELEARNQARIERYAG